MGRHMSRKARAPTYTYACNGLKSRVQSGIETESRSLDTQMRGNIIDMMLYIFKWMSRRNSYHNSYVHQQHTCL